MAKENSGIMKKVVKFGGSSLASAEQFKKVGAIITSDESRVYVVPSAPGKRFSDDTKVTDMLLHVYETAKAGNDFTEEVKAIKARYDEIITGLEIKDFHLIRILRRLQSSWRILPIRTQCAHWTMWHQEESSSMVRLWLHILALSL